MSEADQFNVPQDPQEVIYLMQQKFERDVAFVESTTPPENASPVEQIAFGFFANRLEADALFLRRLKKAFPDSEVVPPATPDDSTTA